MNHNLLAGTMLVAYLLFAVGSHSAQPLNSASCAADSVLAKRAKPAEEPRAPLPRRG